MFLVKQVSVPEQLVGHSTTHDVCVCESTYSQELGSGSTTTHKAASIPKKHESAPTPVAYPLDDLEDQTMKCSLLLSLWPALSALAFSPAQFETNNIVSD